MTPELRELYQAMTATKQSLLQTAEAREGKQVDERIALDIAYEKALAASYKAERAYQAAIEAAAKEAP